MDCKRADGAIMEYMDKTIKPAAAKALALHLLECESCKEYFTALDTAMDELDAGEIEFREAPAGFTEAVMAKVENLALYEKKKPVVSKGLVLRIAGGLCAIFVGVMLMITSGVTSVPELDNAFNALKTWASGVVTRVTQDGIPFLTSAELSFPNLGIYALLFAVIAVVLLVTLQRGENADA